MNRELACIIRSRLNKGTTLYFYNHFLFLGQSQQESTRVNNSKTTRFVFNNNHNNILIRRASSVQKDVLSRNDHEEVASFPFPEISTSLSLTMNEPAQALEFLHEHQAIQSCESIKKKKVCVLWVYKLS